MPITVEMLEKLEKVIDDMPTEELLKYFDNVTEEEAAEYAILEKWLLDRKYQKSK